MNLPEISIRRPVMMSMVVLSFVVLGLFSLSRLGIDIFPEVDFPFVIATIVYPGAGPQEIETQISEPIEEEASTIGGIKNVTSISQEGVSIILCEFDLGIDVDLAAIDVKDKIDLLRSRLPKDILDPVIQKFDFSALPIIDLAVSSPRPLEETYKLADDVVKTGLSRVLGVANIQLTGGREREIQVHLSRRQLRAYNLSPQMVIDEIAAANLNIPAGHVNEGRREITVRMEGEFTDIKLIGDVEIPLEEGRRVKLDQIGWVEDSFKEQRERAYFNGESSVGLGIIKRSGANTVQVASSIYKELDRIRTRLPDDMQIEVARDRSQFIKDSIDDIFGNIIVGVLLTAIVLFLFLHSVRATVIAAVSMPTSIIATFILLDFAGFTLNFMSLLGLAVSVGILVANSIVVLENIERFRGKGIGATEAASRGTAEIAVAVAASTLTNVVVFTPMAFMSGIVGRFFIQFGLTVAFATMFSLLVSFTLTPMMASKPVKTGLYVFVGGLTFLVIWWRLGIDPALLFILALAALGLAQSVGVLGRLFAFWDGLYASIEDDYRRSLAWVMRHKFVTLFAVAVLFLGSLSLSVFGFIGGEFFPRTDQGLFSVGVEMAVGSSLDETNRTVVEIGRRIMRHPEVKSVYESCGRTEGSEFGSGQGVHLGVVVAQMVDIEKRNINTADFIANLRPQLTDFPGAKISLKETSPFGGGGESDLQIEITGPNMDRLNAIADSVQRFTRAVGGVVNINTSWQIGKPEFRIKPRRRVLSDKEFQPAQLGETMRIMIEGVVASKFRDEGEEYDIRVKLDPAEIKRVEDVEGLYVKTGERQTTLGEIVDLEYAEGPTSIGRKNRQRLVTVTADVAVGTIGEKVAGIRKLTDAMALPAGYGIFFGGEAEMMAESFAELFKALFLAIILTYMLLAAIMESLKHPFTIMLTFPLGLIGVLMSLFLTGNSISMFSLMALVMLVGIVVNNGILLIDYITRLRKDGMRLDEAILEACPVRLRPIIMTNLATMLGVLPLALGLGSGGEFRSPMGIVTIGGLITSTIFTLYLIPTVYRMFEKEKA